MHSLSELLSELIELLLVGKSKTFDLIFGQKYGLK
jgi:hypothetical protein